MKEEGMADKGRAFPVDPNVPRWVCQNCRNPLCVVGVVSYAEKLFNDASRSGMQESSIHGANSVLSMTKMDSSYVVLPKQRLQTQGTPPHPHGGAVQPDIGLPGKAMEESFVVVYKSESTSDGSGANLLALGADPSVHLQPHNSGFNSTITVLKRAFHIATMQTQVEQPLCLECMRILSDKLDKEVEDVNKDIEAYEACLKRLEGDAREVLSEAEFLKEKLKIEEEERRLEDAIKETERQNADVNAELRELESKSSHFKELEERYWHEFNNFQFQLISHQEERDAILAKIEASQAHLELLKGTNVLKDAFPISHDGEFGTINNFRLGRLPKIPDEINAAWGQACLLLHTMCQYFRPKFQYRKKIIPIGSCLRITDINNVTYDLFGPVNLFWCTRYDRAMTLFLACLKDFADFANSKDQENNIPREKCFKLPYNLQHCLTSGDDEMTSVSLAACGAILHAVDSKALDGYCWLALESAPTFCFKICLLRAELVCLACTGERPAVAWGLQSDERLSTQID